MAKDLTWTQARALAESPSQPAIRRANWRRWIFERRFLWFLLKPAPSALHVPLAPANEVRITGNVRHHEIYLPGVSYVATADTGGPIVGAEIRIFVAGINDDLLVATTDSRGNFSATILRSLVHSQNHFTISVKLTDELLVGYPGRTYTYQSIYYPIPGAVPLVWGSFIDLGTIAIEAAWVYLAASPSMVAGRYLSPASTPRDLSDSVRSETVRVVQCDDFGAPEFQARDWTDEPWDTLPSIPPPDQMPITVPDIDPEPPVSLLRVTWSGTRGTHHDLTSSSVTVGWDRAYAYSISRLYAFPPGDGARTGSLVPDGVGVYLGSYVETDIPSHIATNGTEPLPGAVIPQTIAITVASGVPTPTVSALGLWAPYDTTGVDGYRDHSAAGEISETVSA